MRSSASVRSTLRKIPSNPGISSDDYNSQAERESIAATTDRYDLQQQQLQEDALYAEAASEAPSSPGWREQRLRGIGAASDPIIPPSDVTRLRASTLDIPSYGATRSNSMSKISRRKELPSALEGLRKGRWNSSLQRLASLSSPDRSYFRTLRRPPSAYDSPLATRLRDDEDHRAEKVNGIRVWYSSFQSIDWLHDAIKDVARLRRLRRKKSVRAKIVNALDRFSGWFIVSVVGFLTALISYFITISEKWLFDLKDGHCNNGWWKARSTCCSLNDFQYIRDPPGSTCRLWKTWDELLDLDVGDRSWLGTQRWAIKYISYTIVAVLLALLSSLLTIHLTASSSFVTHKDSGVLVSSHEGATSSTSSPKRRVMYYAAGSGIPEIKTILSGESCFVIHGYLGGRTLFTKAVGLALSVASGLSLGKEGPMVHIASCVGNIISKRREILSAASAAGVAVAFGAPIGGVLFSLEEVSYFFPPKVMWRSFFGAMIAAVTLKFLDPFGTGKLVLLQVTYDKDWHAFELLFFLILGVFGGVYGAYFSKMNYRWSKHVRDGTWLKTHPVSEVILVTSVTALLSFLNPFTRMGGTELVYNLLAECRDGDYNGGLCVSPASVGPIMRAIAIALIVKGILTIVTFGIKVPAGIFIPTLGVGACFGRIVGLGVEHLYWKHPDLAIFATCERQSGCIIPGIYAMVGAAATLSGVTRTTVSLAVIVFELTDTLTYTVPVMLAILVAKTVADALEPKGIYDLVIELSQLPYLDAKRQHLWGGLHLGDAIDREVEVIRADRLNSVELLRDQLQRALLSGDDDGGFPVVREEDDVLKLVGYIGLNELEHALSLVADSSTRLVHFRWPAESAYQMAGSVSSLYDAPIGPDPFDFTVFMDQAPLTVVGHAPLELVQQMFVKLGARYVIAVRSDGAYEGLISKKHWLAFLSELH